ncbi:MAG: extracellular solute-binding protein, partial [Deinococcota bacterium]
MKRLILLSILLVLGLACAQPMEFWRFGNEDDNDNQAMLSWVDEWNELNPDKAVEMRFFPFGDYASGTPLVTAFAAGTGPDIFLVSPATYMQYARSGILADLSSIFTPEVRGDFREASLEAASYDGVPVAMPMQMGPIALFYNRDLFAQVGAEVPRSWDELLAVSDLFLDNDIIPIVIETPPGPYQNFTWYPFLWQTGANVSNDNLTEATFDTEGMAAALNLWATLINEGYAPRTSLDCTCNIGSTPFASGEAAMQVVGSF